MSDDVSSPGTRLVAAREARGMSHAQAAEQLRLTVPVIKAMEEGRYQDLGAAVFARGHLRKYATLLGLQAEPLLADYEASSDRAAESTLIPPASAHTPVRASRLGRVRIAPWQGWLLAGLLLLIVAAAGWFYWQGRSRSQVDGGALVPAPSFAEPGQGGAVESPDPSTPPADQAEDPPAGPQTTGSNLTLEFSHPCWIEVYDANGLRLAYDLADPGSVRHFGGPAPWRVVLGDARAVRLEVDGRPVSFPSGLVSGQMASLLVSDAEGPQPSATLAARGAG